MRRLVSVVVLLSLMSSACPTTRAWAQEPAEGQEAPPAAQPEDAQASSQEGPPVEGPPDGVARERWTPTTYERRTSDGRGVLEVSPLPRFYRDEQGRWQGIDTRPVISVDGTEFRPRRAAKEAVRLPRRLGGRPLRIGIGTGKGDMRVRHLGARDAAGMVVGRGVRYPDALPGGRDLLLAATVNGFEDSVVLRDSSSPGSHRMEFGLPTGVSARQVDRGIEFVDESGAVLAVYGRGLAFDSSGTIDELPAETPVAVRLLAQDEGVATVEVAVDPTWLADPARVFPVTVDPPYEVSQYDDGGYIPNCGTGGLDAASPYAQCDLYVNSDNPVEGKYYLQSELRVGWTGRGETVTYLKFPTDSFGSPGHAVEVVSASIRVNNWSTSSTRGAEADYHMYPSASSPDYNTAWGNRPSRASETHATVRIEADGWQTFSGDGLRQIVQSWFDGSAQNHGVHVVAAAGTTGGSLRRWRSGEYSADDAPVLHVEYNRPPATPEQVAPDNGVQLVGSPTLTARYLDPDGGSGRIHFEVFDANGARVALADVGLVNSGSTATYAPQLSAGWHTWRARAWDGRLYSPWSAARGFRAHDGLVGERDFHTYEELALSDRRSAKVNVTSGNLNLREVDLSIAGTGLDATVERFYNSRFHNVTEAGSRWQLWPQSTTRLHPAADGSVTLVRDYQVTFPRNADGSYAEPGGMNAKLTRNPADGRYMLDFYRTAERWEFNAAGYLQARVDRNGNRITYGYDAGGTALQTMTDTRNRTVAFTRAGGATLVTSATDSSGRIHAYGYTGTDLTSYTDPAGQITRYVYTGGYLSSITDARGNVTRFDSDGLGRVTRIVRVTDALAGTGPTTTFTYNLGNTVVNDANGHATTYHYDARGRVERIVDARGNQRARGYNANSNVTTTTDGGTNVTTYGFSTDGRNNPTGARLPTGANSTLEYANPRNLYAPSRYLTPQGNALTYDYDARGNLASVTDSAGAGRTEVAYNPDGTIDFVKDPRLKVTDYAYDPGSS
jgi:YD repeat-containing protein